MQVAKLKQVKVNESLYFALYQMIYQKAVINWLCKYLCFLNIIFNRLYPVERAFLNWLCQHLCFLNTFFNKFCTVGKYVVKFICSHLNQNRKEGHKIYSLKLQIPMIIIVIIILLLSNWLSVAKEKSFN